MDKPAPKKYVIGWLTFRPGMRDMFLDRHYRVCAEASRREEGCVFYDYGVSATDPNLAFIFECFQRSRTRRAPPDAARQGDVLQAARVRH